MKREENEKDRARWELIKKLMPELAAEIRQHPGFFKHVRITVK